MSACDRDDRPDVAQPEHAVPTKEELSLERMYAREIESYENDRNTLRARLRLLEAALRRGNLPRRILLEDRMLAVRLECAYLNIRVGDVERSLGEHGGDATAEAPVE